MSYPKSAVWQEAIKLCVSNIKTGMKLKQNISRQIVRPIVFSKQVRLINALLGKVASVWPRTFLFVSTLIEDRVTEQSAEEINYRWLFEWLVLALPNFKGHIYTTENHCCAVGTQGFAHQPPSRQSRSAKQLLNKRNLHRYILQLFCCLPAVSRSKWKLQ